MPRYVTSEDKRLIVDYVPRLGVEATALALRVSPTTVRRIYGQLTAGTVAQRREAITGNAGYRPAYTKGQELESPRGGMRVIVAAVRPTPLATTDGGTVSGGWCRCREQRPAEQGYFEDLETGDHGWYCFNCRGIRQTG